MTLALVDDTQNVWRGSQPKVPEWNDLKVHGITHVVKLNEQTEGDDLAATALGMDVLYRPINLCDQLIFRPSKPFIVDAVNGIVPNTFVHCSHGEDRTGLVIGCWRVWRCGWTKEAAWKEMLDHGFHFELLGLSLFWEWAV